MPKDDPTGQEVIAMLEAAGISTPNARDAVFKARGGEEAELWTWARAGGDPKKVPAYVKR